MEKPIGKAIGPRPIKEMKLKTLLTENKNLVWAIAYIERGKDALYSFLEDDEHAKESIRSWFPIDSLVGSITGSSNSSKQNEGREIAHSDIEKIIIKLDDIILSLADSNRENK